MKATKDFKYSPNGIKVVHVQSGDELTDEALPFAKKLGCVQKKATKPTSNKSAK